MNRLNFTLLFIVAFLTSHATQWTVSNRTDLPQNPGQFTTIQAAINAASAGDTILVAGSNTNYASVTISKKVILIGTGYDPDKENKLVSTINGITLNSSSTSGSVIMGFALNGAVNFLTGSIYSNITIRRCFFLNNGIIANDSTINMVIAENVFWLTICCGNEISYGTSRSSSNLLITNNIFGFSANGNNNCINNNGGNAGTVSITHNLFIVGDNQTPLVSSNWRSAFGTLFYSVVSNNIFYNVNPITTSGSNNTFNNNLSFAGNPMTAMPPSGNVGSGNINYEDPQFISIFNNTSDGWIDFYLDNLRLQSTSPAKNAGTDGTDIGPTGGLYPIYRSTNRYLTGEPPIPEVKIMDFTGCMSSDQSGLSPSKLM